MEIFQEVKLEIYIPETSIKHLQEVLHQVHAGHIGNYDHCLSITNVRGYWRPLEGANPFQGHIGDITEGTECKVEVRCQRDFVSDALKAIRRIHPYEEPLINVIPLVNELF
jgi:hypothetical protein